MLTPSTVDTSTKARLLEAGGEVFAQRGFREATVREICQMAGANVSAVKYHFGDKASFYVAVVKYALECAADRYPFEASEDDPRPAEERLRAYIEVLLQRLLDKGRPAWHGKLMVRELAEPSHGFDVIVDELARSLFQGLDGIVRCILGPKASENQIKLCVHSIIGQCTFYRHARYLLIRLDPDGYVAQNDIAIMADHITAFSLDALKAMVGKIAAA